jgi:uncharacterized protein (UPF0303 family)
MFMRNAIVSYSLLLFSPKEKNNFESLGRKAKTSGDTAIRRLQSAEKSLALLGSMIQKVFKNKKKLYLVVDDTLIKNRNPILNQSQSKIDEQSWIGRKKNSNKLLT